MECSEISIAINLNGMKNERYLWKFNECLQPSLIKALYSGTINETRKKIQYKMYYDIA